MSVSRDFVCIEYIFITENVLSYSKSAEDLWYILLWHRPIKVKRVKLRRRAGREREKEREREGEKEREY